MLNSAVRGVRFFWKWLLWVHWALIFLFWFQGSADLFREGFFGALVAFGRLAGLAAAYTILLQFFFMGRMPWLERAFGLDVLSRLHQKNGRRGLVFLLLHPILLVGGYSGLSGVNPLAQLSDFLLHYDYVLLAAFGFCLFLLVIAVSFLVVRSGLRYETWYFVHLCAYLAVFASFWHQLAVGGDLLESRFFYGYWIALYVGVFGSHFVFRIARPPFLFARHRFVVQRVLRENATVLSIYIAGRDLQRFRIQPGQFMILRFFARGLWWQAHPFSLSMMPSGKELRVTVKELGDFTRTLQRVPLGTHVLIDGPYGVFTDLFSESSRVLFIAGGIGITPIRSLVEQMLSRGKDIFLLYGSRTFGDIVFEKELDVLKSRYAFPLIHVLSADETYSGEKGRIDGEKIMRLVPDILEREVYLCGPPPMMELVIGELGRIGVPRARIRYERFSF